MLKNAIKTKCDGGLGKKLNKISKIGSGKQMVVWNLIHAFVCVFLIVCAVMSPLFVLSCSHCLFCHVPIVCVPCHNCLCCHVPIVCVVMSSFLCCVVIIVCDVMSSLFVMSCHHCLCCPHSLFDLPKSN